MKEFKENFEEGLTKGLRRFKTNPRNNQALLECHNWEPTEKGLKPREEIEGLTIVNLPGDIDETIYLSDVYWYGDGYPEFPTARFPPDEPPPTPGPPEPTFPCPPECTLAWNEGFSAETITTPGVGGQNEVSIGVTGGTPPYTWSVSGTGFSLEFTTTTSGNNTLYADDTACGTATITVTDVCGCSVVGYVRASDGEWCLTNIYGCTITGDHTGQPTGSYPGGGLTLIKNQYKQWVRFHAGEGASSGPTCDMAKLRFACVSDEDPCRDPNVPEPYRCDDSNFVCSDYYNINQSTTPCGECVTNLEERLLATRSVIGDNYDYHGVEGSCNTWCFSYGCPDPFPRTQIECFGILEIKVWEWECSC
ncbi:hypothetical protein LCGC14_1895540 [marine sediment metagenome]|uniref:Uncharacterized protein n=1 Tax=marine sediment metagenome TaxID=412755 RepID=A0A0F9IC26_9ZZZZ